MLLLHVGAFHLDVDSRRSSFWHQLTPRTRILCTVLFVFASALTPNGRWWTWVVYGVELVLLVLLSRITLTVLVRRLAVEFLFIGAVLLGTLFHESGVVVWQWGWLRITSGGLTVLGSVTLKALLSMTMLNVLILTTSIPSLLHALTTLRMPPLLVAILAAMYRYLNVLINELNSMQRAALSRNLMNTRHWHRLVIGNMIGALFIRTYERGDRIHQAMLARGYTGLPPVAEIPKGGSIDILALTIAVGVALLGHLIYLY